MHIIYIIHPFPTAHCPNQARIVTHTHKPSSRIHAHAPISDAIDLHTPTSTAGSCSFSGNAGGMGGALFVGDGANMQISESVSFTANKALLNGGALLTSPLSNITISGSNVSFAGNVARFGGQASFYGKVAIQVRIGGWCWCTRSWMNQRLLWA